MALCEDYFHLYYYYYLQFARLNSCNSFAPAPVYIHLVSHLTVPVPWFCFRELEGSLSSSLEHFKAPKVPKHNPSRRQSNSAVKDRVLKRRKEKPVEGDTGRGERPDTSWEERERDWCTEYCSSCVVFAASKFVVSSCLSLRCSPKQTHPAL